jgi:hypothetical protein
MGEGIAALFVAVAAQLSYRGCFWLLSVGIVAGFALYSSRVVWAGAPFIRRVLMTGTAQLGIGFDRHLLQRMTGLEGSMASFAAHAFFEVLSTGRVKTGRMAGQARYSRPSLNPVFLKDGR